MQLIRTVAALREAAKILRSDGGRLALVPTMGALHAGHMALIERARALAPHVAVSIFVNPAQFGPNEDLATYPRREDEDASMLEAAGCELIWAPATDEVYPPGFATTVSVAGVSEGLCGAARPGHFEGVATVVAKLFNQLRPDIALFGEKDYQQLAVIRRMTRDLDMDVEIVAVPIVRETDGLALSSRNAYLSLDERARAVALPEALREAARAIVGGAAVAEALSQAKTRLADAGFAPEYVALRDADTLHAVDRLEAPARILAAARIGNARLIDIVAVELA